MLQEVGGRFEATCEKCGAREVVEAIAREQAILRLIRAGWHVVTTGETLCAGCHDRPTLRRPRYR